MIKFVYAVCPVCGKRWRVKDEEAAELLEEELKNAPRSGQEFEWGDWVKWKKGTHAGVNVVCGFGVQPCVKIDGVLVHPRKYKVRALRCGLLDVWVPEAELTLESKGSDRRL